ncbi:MAG: hypothetical protein WB557_34910 [Solirubrobacteraceae bacterium]
MKRSTTRILTTHAGSLPYADDVAPTSDGELRRAVADIVARQRELGLDLINEGEYTKGGDWLSFADERFAEVYRANTFYATDTEYLYALADALRVEYELIVEAGFVLQVDDAWLPALWDRIGIEMGLEAFRERCRTRVQALNHALANIPEERVRYHMCWGSWHGPHAHDLELVHLADVLLAVKAQAYLIEGANARHEHEWAVWRDVHLPEGKILIPGVVTHSTDVVEHPDLVAQRIERFASVVGAENVIAGTDCGFGGRTHPQIAWAKLRSLTEGAARASRALGFGP